MNGVRSTDSATYERVIAEPPVEVETAGPVVASVIWLHGLGADGHDFEPIVPELNLPADRGVRFVFPHAPFRSVTINNGFRMRAWYDLSFDGRGFQQNEGHIQESAGIVSALVERETRRGIPPGRIAIAGFSQGGAVVLYAGVRLGLRLAGIMSLSAPAVDCLQTGVPERLVACPVFLAHGTEDEVVPLNDGERNRTWLEALGLKPEWRVYPIGHGVNHDEIMDISDWLNRILGL